MIDQPAQQTQRAKEIFLDALPLLCLGLAVKERRIRVIGVLLG